MKCWREWQQAEENQPSATKVELEQRDCEEYQAWLKSVQDSPQKSL
ncbi:hypothetical protein SynBIOSE41_03760 [Synechococcus sp. BIOS-E4-1]|nr:hypothetical protein SynBIOSE41_03760 [Synechococcus sp. BIOS-E4-1]